MILDGTYFQGELYLPLIKNKEEVEGLAEMMQTIGENTLEWFIAKYETEFLKKILGEKLYSNFIAGLKVDPIDPKWEALKDSLFIKDERFSFSPAANYVYFYVTVNGKTSTTLKGEVLEEQSYAKAVTNGDKLVKPWNEMCRQISKFYCDFLFANWGTYKEYADIRTCLPSREFTPINTMGI